MARNYKERQHAMIYANHARQNETAALRDEITVVNGTETLRVARDGYGEIHVFTATGTFVGGFTPETFRQTASVLLPLELAYTLGNTMLGTDAINAILAYIN